MAKKILWHVLRLGFWLFAWTAIVYVACFLPRATASLIEGGIGHPKFWPRLFVTILVATGVVMGVITMVHVTKMELVLPLLGRLRKGDKEEPHKPTQAR